MSWRTVHTFTLILTSLQRPPLHNDIVYKTPSFILKRHADLRNEVNYKRYLILTTKMTLLRRTKPMQTDVLTFTSFCFVNIFLLNINFWFLFPWYIITLYNKHRFKIKMSSPKKAGVILHPYLLPLPLSRRWPLWRGSTIPYFLKLTPPAFISNLAWWTGVCLKPPFMNKVQFSLLSSLFSETQRQFLRAERYCFSDPTTENDYYQGRQTEHI